MAPRDDSENWRRRLCSPAVTVALVPRDPRLDHGIYGDRALLPARVGNVDEAGGAHPFGARVPWGRVPRMKYVHAMIRVQDPQRSLDFYRRGLGLTLLRQHKHEGGRFTLYFLATAEGEPAIELTHNWDERAYTQGTHFGHLAFEVPDIYESCRRLMDAGVAILRPPRDGRMAFVRDPDGISIELLQAGAALGARDPWRSMPNQGSW
ncbi:MAG: lactoylglutathione lyase [Nannocystaceae bacterium]